MRYLTYLVLAVLAGACASSARVPATTAKSVGQLPSSPLYREIAKQDSALTAAFNAHDLDALMALFNSDLEFYHDRGGLQSYSDVRIGFGNLFHMNNGIERRLQPGTLRVFPIKDYGALELGTHEFCHRENGRLECGSFEFVQLWKRVGATWKLARVVSFGH
ncbi:MAG TPA: nuclear transport factor 2 family protein [Gemmatimonadaceae bacterium]|nr:nuclear transport factor 2 family protein [Gemmatimonadaceae bacterium]